MKIHIASQRGWINHGNGFWHSTDRVPNIPYKEYLCKKCKEIFLADRKGQLYCSHKCQPHGFEYGWRKGKKFPNERGGFGNKRMTSRGYVAIYLPGNPLADKRGRVPEHRLIMQKRMKRPLTPNDVVHHINGDKTDNRAKNLMLTNKFTHSSIHKKEEAKNRERCKKGRFIVLNH